MLTLGKDSSFEYIVGEPKNEHDYLWTGRMLERGGTWTNHYTIDDLPQAEDEHGTV